MSMKTKDDLKSHSQKKKKFDIQTTRKYKNIWKKSISKFKINYKPNQSKSTANHDLEKN